MGDIHGHLGTLRALMHRLNLQEEDRVVLLGDMIDRAPILLGLLNVRQHPQIIAIKGNTEQMASNPYKPQISNLILFGWLKALYLGLLHCSSKETCTEPNLLLLRIVWLADLPSHIVLDDWRLVHAGYHPE